MKAIRARRIIEGKLRKTKATRPRLLDRIAVKTDRIKQLKFVVTLLKQVEMSGRAEHECDQK